MKLIIAVVQSEDAPGLARALTENGFLFTRVSSRGGFLDRENTTFFLGVEEGRLDEAKGIIIERAETREVDHGGTPVEVGGAVVFVLDVEEFLRL